MALVAMVADMAPVAVVADMTLVAMVADMALVAVVADMALVAVVAEMALVAAVDELVPNVKYDDRYCCSRYKIVVTKYHQIEGLYATCFVATQTARWDAAGKTMNTPTCLQPTSPSSPPFCFVGHAYQHESMNITGHLYNHE